MSRWFQETDTIGDIAKAYRTMKKEQIWEKMEIYNIKCPSIMYFFIFPEQICSVCSAELKTLKLKAV